MFGGNVGGGGLLGGGGGYGPSGPYGAYPGCGCSTFFIMAAGLLLFLVGACECSTCRPAHTPRHVERNCPNSKFHTKRGKRCEQFVVRLLQPAP